MKNPSKVSQPRLTNPVGKKEGNKGNLPYLKYRRKLRRGMWG